MEDDEPLAKRITIAKNFSDDECYMNQLPDEILDKILSNAPWEDIYLMRPTCTKWRQIIYPYRISPKELYNKHAKRGNLNVLKYLRQFYYDKSYQVCAFAALGGHLDVVKWAKENEFAWDSSVCANAAQGGHMEILKWAHQNDCPWDASTCTQAAGSGHLNILKWACDNGCPCDPQLCLAAAARNAHIPILEYFYNKNIVFEERVFGAAALGRKRNTIQTLNWLYDRGYDWGDDPEILADVAETGNKTVVAWFLDRDCECTSSAVGAAALYGHLSLCKYMVERGGQLDATVFGCAVCNGSNEILEWLKEVGCPWDAEVFAEAAERSDVEVLQWLKDNGCPCDERAIAASRDNSDEVEQWFIDNYPNLL